MKTEERYYMEVKFMKKALIVLLVSFLLLCVAATASAGVHGHFVSEEDSTYLIILKDPISTNLSGVYMGSDNFLFALDRADNEDGTTRIYSPLDMSDSIIELLLSYEDDSMEAILVTGYIKRYREDGTLMEDQSIHEMQDVRFIRQEVPPVTQLQGTRWLRYSMTISGTSREYPFDGSIIEFFDTEDNTGQIPDNVERTYPFTYVADGDTLALSIEAGGKVTEATVRIEANVLIVTIENSVLYFLPAAF